MRRVHRLNPAAAARSGQDELFAVYRYHAVFTDNPQQMLNAEATHRDRAIIEQVIADLKDSALAHLPSGQFHANVAWLVCAAIAHNLTRAAGALASRLHGRAPTATVRTQRSRRARPRSRSGLTPLPGRARPETTVEKPGRPADHPTPHNHNPNL